MKVAKSAYAIQIIWSEEDRLYIAEVPELEGCITHGKTPEQAARRAGAAIAGWVAAARKLGHPVPEPVASRKVSGKFNVRLPLYLHRLLALRAATDKVSLNQLITSLVSRGA